MNNFETRRVFLQQLATATGAVVLMPIVSACSSAPAAPTTMPTEDGAKAAVTDEVKTVVDANSVPMTKPADWDPITYNKVRGNAGMIPETYLKDINGADGDAKHLGKHLPYVPKVDASLLPAGFIAIMWGDPDKGHAKHPNAPKNDAENYEGHWYNWIKVRKAVEGETMELLSEYVDWPGTANADAGYVVMGGGDITEDGGRNTVYLASLPDDCKPGDTIRIHAHCLTHGEYVDFITI